MRAGPISSGNAVQGQNRRGFENGQVSYARLRKAFPSNITSLSIAPDTAIVCLVAVIGDGAMTTNQAYEAMNNAGYLDSNLIIILNYSNQVSLPTATLDGPTPPVGALSSALSKLQSSKKLRKWRETTKVIQFSFIH